jgi:hypothetical protein
MLDNATILRAPKVLLHDHLDGGLRPTTVIDLAREAGLHGAANAGSCRAPGLVHPRRGPQVAGALPRRLCAHGRAHAAARRDRARRARSASQDLAADGARLRRGALCAGALDRRPGSRSTRSSKPSWTASKRGMAAAKAAPAGRSWCASCALPCASTRGRWRSPSWPSAGAIAAASASTSPVPRRASRRPATSTPSTWSSARTSTRRSTPASRSASRRSGKPSSGAARPGSATRFGSWTTSPSTS